MDHTQVVATTCKTCHANAVYSDVKQLPSTATHIPTSTADCASCHKGVTTFTGWAMDHTVVTAVACQTCHTNPIKYSNATGLPTTKHIPLGSGATNCGGCHKSRTSWSWTSNADMDHTLGNPVSGSCVTCHGNGSATFPSVEYKTTSHFDFGTNLAALGGCEGCHKSQTSWSTVTYNHAKIQSNGLPIAAGYFPGTHKSSVTCKNCHTSNSQTIPWPNASYKNACAGCHSGNFASHKAVNSPATNYTVGQLLNCSGACHVYATGTITTSTTGNGTGTGTIATTRNGPQHRSNSSGFGD